MLHPWHEWNQFPIDIDIHHIPANDQKSEAAHVHYDFRYLLSGSHPVGPAEHPTAWESLSDLKVPTLAVVAKKIRALNIVEN